MQRYGLDVNGGAELYCRLLAEKLSTFYDVDVYTTCVVDHVTWADYYNPGIDYINDVTVHRFRVSKKRNVKKFGKISSEVLGVTHSDADEETWINEQGSVCESLLNELSAEHSKYKAVIFMTYLYYLTAKGLQLGFDNALLIPTMHDEPPVYLRYYDKVMQAEKGFIWNSVEEKAFAIRRFPTISTKPSVMAGLGFEAPPDSFSVELPEQIKDLEYVLYAGRIEDSKGCSRLFDYFAQYKKQHGGNLKLVLVGKAVMPIPKSPDIIELGFVSEVTKFAVMREAKVLLLFSQFESLSMVVLESMTMGRPVIVNGSCEVLKGHCLRSNAGLYFENYPEFAGCLDYLLTHEDIYEAMRLNGKKYVAENYQWDIILGKIRGLIDLVGKNEI